MDLYIYYRAAATDATAVLAEASTLQRWLRDNHQVHCALKRRPDADNGRHTWMEVYHAVPDDFIRHIEQALTRTRLAGLTDGARHTEHFLDYPPCA
ncbi:MAG: DUF4936 family protein [Herminiimonas sp.]|nr:DUF4936 family protein [Herminiimonas sp.]